MKSTRFLILIFALVSCFVMIACTVEAEPTVVPMVIDTAIANASPTRTMIRTITPTASPTMTNMPMVPLPTRTPIFRTPVTDPTKEPLYEGQQLPEAEVINKDNITQLELVADWGKGQIQDIAFAPDGQTFVVGSEKGYMIYDAVNLDAEPIWHPFNVDFPFNQIYFDTDGQVLNFHLYQERWASPDIKEDTFYRYNTGVEISHKSYLEWVYPQYQTTVDDLEFQISSSDGEFILEMARNIECAYSNPYYEYDEDEWGITYGAVGGFMKNSDSEYLYTLDEDVPCISYETRVSPDGCDLHHFGWCGNAFAPVGLVPEFASFAVDNSSLAIQYFPWGLFSEDRFRMIRVYEPENGGILFQLGEIGDPTQDFSYSPDGQTLAVAYQSGLVELWQINPQKLLLSSDSVFTSPTWYTMVSADSQHLLAQRADVVDVYDLGNGEFISRFPSTTLGVSPTENLFVTTEENGAMYLRELPDGKIIRQMWGHQDTIYQARFSPDGIYVLTSGEDCRRILWEVKSGAIKLRLDPITVNAIGEEHTESRILVWYFEVLPELNEIIGYGSWGTVGFWNLETGEVKEVITSEKLDYYQGIPTLNPHFPTDFLLDIRQNYFAIDGNFFNLELKELIAVGEDFYLLNENCTHTLLYTLEGDVRIAGGSENHPNRLCYLETHSAEPMFSYEESLLFPLNQLGTQNVMQLELTPDGKRLIAETTSGTFYIFQVNK